MLPQRFILILRLGSINVFLHSLLIHSVDLQLFHSYSEGVFLFLLILETEVNIADLDLNVVDDLKDKPRSEAIVLFSVLLLQPFCIAFQHCLLKIIQFLLALFHEPIVAELPIALRLIPQNQVNSIEIHLSLAGGETLPRDLES